MSIEDKLDLEEINKRLCQKEEPGKNTNRAYETLQRRPVFNNEWR